MLHPTLVITQQLQWSPFVAFLPIGCFRNQDDRSVRFGHTPPRFSSALTMIRLDLALSLLFPLFPSDCCSSRLTPSLPIVGCVCLKFITGRLPVFRFPRSFYHGPVTSLFSSSPLSSPFAFVSSSVTLFLCQGFLQVNYRELIHV